VGLTPGSRIGPYEVLASVGAGGMGEVFRARDARLGRDVALKVLPGHFAADPDRLARFRREAQLLASLNHPHIAAIYGLEESGAAGPADAGHPVRALVLELVEGETLADRIVRGPIAIEEALQIARQIAEALEAAHEHGIIHRDLKPANIKITSDGIVKVLDFGLAKLSAPNNANVPHVESGFTVSPTVVSPAMMTGVGVLLGTAAYMSPEQARGRPADKRSDVWAFGCVLFEMLAGRRAFAGHETSEVLAAVIASEPQWSALPTGVPPTLLVYLRRCLHKDPKQRLRDVGDLRLALEGAFDTPPVPVATAAPRLSTRWRYAVLVGALIVASVAIGLGILSTRRAPALVPVRFSITLPPAAWQLNPNGPPVLALSSDGATIVYAGRDQMYRRNVGELVSQPIPGTTSSLDNLNTPFFSPDGAWVGFFRAGALRKVALAGGPVTTIVETTPRGASWGPDDMIVYGSPTGLMRVPASSGEPERVTSLADGELGHYRPEILPNGKAALFTIWSGSYETAKIAVASLRTSERQTLFPGSYPRYSPTGHIVFAREASLWAAPFDADTLQVTGRAVPVLDTVRIERTSGVAQFAIAKNGSLIYAAARSGTGSRRLVWVDRQGREEPLKLEPGPYSEPTVSPDGSRVAMTVTRADDSDIWIWDLVRETFERFTFDAGNESAPLWSRDGSRIVFQSATGLSWKPLSTGQVERLLENPNRPLPTSWTPDGRLIFQESSPGVRNIGALSVDGKGKAEMLLADSRFNEDFGTLSPNGRWLAYTSNESGGSELYVRPFPEVNTRTWQVSQGGGGQPRWSADGRELIYRGPESLMVSRIQEMPTFSRETPRALFSTAGYVFVGQSYDLSRNGRLLFMKNEATASSGSESNQQLIFVQDWFEELKRLIPGN
jgi:Protein kinase domain/WD40-like Beta Propeller Repeat